jgi:hypothetical protein
MPDASVRFAESAVADLVVEHTCNDESVVASVFLAPSLATDRRGREVVPGRTSSGRNAARGAPATTRRARPQTRIRHRCPPPRQSAVQAEYGGAISISFGGPQQQQSSVDPALLAYKVYPDGREELLRTAEFAGIADSVFKEIIAVSDSTTTYTFVYSPMSLGGLATIISFGGAGLTSSFGHAVSVSVPDFLFEEISVRNPTGNVPHLPVAGHPFFEE